MRTILSRILEGCGFEARVDWDMLVMTGTERMREALVAGANEYVMTRSSKAVILDKIQLLGLKV